MYDAVLFCFLFPKEYVCKNIIDKINTDGVLLSKSIDGWI